MLNSLNYQTRLLVSLFSCLIQCAARSGLAIFCLVLCPCVSAVMLTLTRAVLILYYLCLSLPQCSEEAECIIISCQLLVSALMLLMRSYSMKCTYSYSMKCTYSISNFPYQLNIGNFVSNNFSGTQKDINQLGDCIHDCYQCKQEFSMSYEE